MNITYDTIQALDEKYNFYIDFAEGYGEPGYCKSGGKKGVLLSNWNDVPKHIVSALEKQYEIEYSDEWIVDHNRGKCYRAQPDSYDWKPSVIFIDGDFFTRDDAEDDPESYIEILVNDSEMVELFDVDLETYGFTKLNLDSYENGLYGTQDKPRDILKQLLQKHPKGEFIFGRYENEQFRCTFSVYGRNL